MAATILNFSATDGLLHCVRSFTIAMRCSHICRRSTRGRGRAYSLHHILSDEGFRIFLLTCSPMLGFCPFRGSRIGPSIYLGPQSISRLPANPRDDLWSLGKCAGRFQEHHRAEMDQFAMIKRAGPLGHWLHRGAGGRQYSSVTLGVSRHGMGFNTDLLVCLGFTGRHRVRACFPSLATPSAESRRNHRARKHGVERCSFGPVPH